MINSIIVQGRLVADPELRVTELSGKEVCAFTIANPRPGTDENGNKTADFFDVIVWEKTAKFVADHFRKGDTIMVAGKLRTRTYTDREGIRRRTFEIHAGEVSFGEKRRERDAD